MLLAKRILDDVREKPEWRSKKRLAGEHCVST